MELLDEELRQCQHGREHLVWERAWKGLGLESLLFETEGRKRETDRQTLRMNGWTEEKKEGRKNLNAAQISKGLRRAPLSLSRNF